MEHPAPQEVAPPPIQPDPRSYGSRSVIRDLLIALLIVAVLGGIVTGVWWYTTIQHTPNRNTAAPPSTANAGKATSNTAQPEQRIAPAPTTPKPTVSNVFADADDDGLSDQLEALYGTDVHQADSDGDGFSDGTEVQSGYDPRIGVKGVRMVDLGLVQRLVIMVPNVQVISSGVATDHHDRYYLVYDGTATSYYASDGSLKAQCATAEMANAACGDLPNQVRTDFTRTIENGAATDVYHLPF